MILPTIAAVQAAVAAEHGVPASIMREPDGLGIRKREFARPRQEAMYLSLLLTGKPCTTIGRCFRRDHSTVLAGEQRIRKRLVSDDELKARMRRLTLQLVRQ